MSKTDVIGPCRLCTLPVFCDDDFVLAPDQGPLHQVCVDAITPLPDNPTNPMGLGIGLKIVSVLARMIQSSDRIQVWEDWAKTSKHPLDDFLIAILKVAVNEAAKL